MHSKVHNNNREKESEPPRWNIAEKRVSISRDEKSSRGGKVGGVQITAGQLPSVCDSSRLACIYTSRPRMRTLCIRSSVHRGELGLKKENKPMRKGKINARM